MRKSLFTDAQIVAIVRESEGEGLTVEQCAKKHGITPTTLFRWRKRFGGLDASQAAELRRLSRSLSVALTSTFLQAAASSSG